MSQQIIEELKQSLLELEKDAAMEKARAIVTAEGERQAQLLRAEGFASALDKIFEVAQTIDPKTMTLQYFETLKNIGASPSTKYIFPMEFTSLLENFVKSREE